MKLSKGFTLIELLIVIGVLGILASGLLAAIDPFEQLKKARDANNRNAAVETLNAMTRYYATHGVLPWDTTISTCTTTPGAGPLLDPLRVASAAYPRQFIPLATSTTLGSNSQMNACVTDTLIADGELKSEFFSGLATTLYVASGSKTTVIVCYAPEGKALRNDPNVLKWDVAGTTIINGCVTPTSGTCLQCFQ